VAFAQRGKRKVDSNNKDDSWQKKATCHHCGETGHIRPNCPILKDNDDKEADGDKSNTTPKSSKDNKDVEKKKKNTSFAQPIAESENESKTENQFLKFGFCTTTISAPMNLRDMILLDKQSTVDLFCNRKLVSHVWETDESVTVHGNGRTLSTKMKAHVTNYSDVWFDSKAITNILSLKNVREKFHVTYDEGSFQVHKPNGIDIHFRMHADGLHYHDTNNRELTMVSTVKSESEGFSKRQLEQAKTARDLQAKVGNPSIQDLKAIIQSNLIVNCPITAEDIDRAEKIYGPSVPILKGKTTRQAPTTVVSDYMTVPPQILSANKDMTLSGDLLFVNKAPFFATISDHIKITTAEHIANRKIKSLVQASKHVQAVYAARAFHDKSMLMDGEFVHLKYDLSSTGIILNTTAANEHVPKIEGQIRVIKERVRATRHTLPFKVIPLTMLIELIYSSTLWINAFPPKGGVSSTLSPRNIMIGIQFDYQKHCRLQFGSYVQTHQEPSPTNTQAARTVGAVCLGPTGNIQGSYKFLNLRTGKLITRRRWTQLPMPQEVIDCAGQLGKADGQPELLTFYDRKGRLIGESETLGVPDAPEATIPNDDNLGDLSPPAVNYYYGPGEEPENPPPIVIHEEPKFPQPIVETLEQATETDIAPIPLLDNQELYPQVEVPDAGATPLRRSHRTVKKPQRLVPTFGSQTYQSTAAVTTHLVYPDAHLDSNYVLVAHYIMAQFSMKAGLKRFKERGEEAITKELSQLHFRDTFEPIKPKDLNEEERLQVLESHLFLKEKRDTTVKGQMVARGNKQRGTIDKQDASSPTAALKSVLLTAVINAKEGRDMAVIDIPNAFFQTRLQNEEDKAVMRLRG
jgi:hypothetical protein